MSIPKFSNPYNLNSSTQKCTRRAIFADSDGETFSDGDAATRKDLEWLEESLRSSFVYRTQEERSTWGRNETERERKRRKKGGTGLLGFYQAAESEFEFRLLSSSTPHEKINIQPKPPRALRRIQREYEDTPELSEERAWRAKEVAVDFNWVQAQSQITFPASRRDSKKLEITALPELSPLSFSSLPNILVTERLNKTSSTETNLPRISRHKGAPSNRFSEAEERPSPHELRGRLCCSLVPVRGEILNVQWKEGEARRRRRRKRGVPSPKQK